MERSSSKEELMRQAASMILEVSSLTDELTDEAAQPLIAWALSQGEAAVDALAASVDLALLPASEAREMVAERMAPVRRVTRAINVLAGERADLTHRQISLKLRDIAVMAQELPAPPDFVRSDRTLKWLAHRTRKDDDAAFVRTMVFMLLSRGRLEETRVGSGRKYVSPKTGQSHEHKDS